MDLFLIMCYNIITVKIRHKKLSSLKLERYGFMLNERKEWVEKVMNDCYKEWESRPDTIECIITKNTVVIMDYEKMTNGMAKCAPGDNFDLDLGVAIAWARMKNIKIPKWVFEKRKKVSELESGDYFNFKNMDYHMCRRLRSNEGVEVYLVYNETKKKMTYLYCRNNIMKFVLDA